MADKTCTVTENTSAAVTTAGSTTVNVITVVFDEDASTSSILSMLDEARVSILNYYADKSS